MLFVVLGPVFWLDLIDFWGLALVKRVVVWIQSAEVVNSLLHRFSLSYRFLRTLLNQSDSSDRF